ncbi:MAG: 1-deoxy-D-xylulose-5-phosphate synthase [Campylobacterales bacterium]|nr:1-deoxy-D-xylulose-5-phosphate synthase [Campylobacterales bacterium]
MNIKSMTLGERKTLCSDIRERILDVVSKNGGHLSSTLGATELIVAMHAVFDIKKDPFIFDVSHQAYAHKLITGRWKEFETLRQFNGLCGYTKPSESAADYYVAGHSSTSISLGVGAAKAFALSGEDRIPVVMIGDGSMSAGMVYEALNELGERKYPMVIVLNDNEMSISKPIGAISKHLSQAMAGPFYQKLKAKTEKILEHLPEGATYLAKRFEESFKLITPGLIFEEMGVEYIGPVDGHDIKSLVETMEIAKNIGKPVIVHAQTIKGKGYELAEGPHEHWHGVSPFDISDGKANKSSKAKSATKIYTEKLLELARKDEKVVGVTAAMPSGTGLRELLDEFPKRFWDVGIAEQHAVTSMGPLAKEGFKPFCTIYSTFLQRGYDQVIHDICLMDLPVVFALDRAGIVGEDGETHQGAFDISFLRAIPNMTLFAPRNETTMHAALDFAHSYGSPCAVRYPRGAFLDESTQAALPFVLGRAELLQESGSDILFVGYGNGVGRAKLTAAAMEEEVGILDLRFVKPLDEAMLRECAKKYSRWFIFSDSAKMGGVGSAILEFLAEAEITGIRLKSFEYEDAFITHGNTTLVEESLGLLPTQLAQKVKASLGK